ncbi:MAG: APC family permease [Promethearchaeota archaeon]
MNKEKEKQDIQKPSIQRSVKKRKKYTWVVVAAMVVGTVVGSGIVKDSVLWTAAGGYWALIGILFIWFAFFSVGIAMCDNVSMIPEKGGAYAWTRETMGDFWGTQIGWIYLLGYTCLSVILSWLAYLYTLSAVLYFYPEKGALLAATIFSIIVPMFFIIIFSIVFSLGIKRATQVIVIFFTIKITMWLTIVGIGLLHFDTTVSTNLPNIDPLGAILAVAPLSVFAMLGLDSPSVIIEDIYNPSKNFLKGLIAGMLIVLLLYLSTVVVIMGLLGQKGAIEYTDNGITGIFLDLLSVPPPVLLVFIVISIIGTLFICMYLVVRLSGAMSENMHFFYPKHTKIHKLERETLIAGDKLEMPIRALILMAFMYAAFFTLIYIETYFGTYFVLYCVYYLGILSILVILFMISLTNFKAHRMGLGKKRRKEKKEFRWARGYFIPFFGMLTIGFIFILSIYFMWTQPAFPLPGPEDSYAWEFWQLLGKIFPVFMVIPGLLFWVIKVRPHTKKEKNESVDVKDSKDKNKNKKKKNNKTEKK